MDVTSTDTQLEILIRFFMKELDSSSLKSATTGTAVLRDMDGERCEDCGMPRRLILRNNPTFLVGS